jgi:dephospho-CoA kinase
MVNFEYAIALTGGIATGKSTVSIFLKELGFEIIDADKIAHEILDKEAQSISKLFGKNIIKDNRVDRVALGNIIFNDKKQKLRLEKFIHPKIYDEIVRLSKIEDKKEKIYFVDIPLFFESNRYNIDKSILVYTSKEIQLERLIKRDNCPKEIAIKKISSQMPIEDKKELASLIIDNSSTIEKLKKEVYENYKIFSQWK